MTEPTKHTNTPEIQGIVTGERRKSFLDKITPSKGFILVVAIVLVVAGVVFGGLSFYNLSQKAGLDQSDTKPMFQPDTSLQKQSNAPTVLPDMTKTPQSQ